MQHRFNFCNDSMSLHAQSSANSDCLFVCLYMVLIRLDLNSNDLHIDKNLTSYGRHQCNDVPWH